MDEFIGQIINQNCGDSLKILEKFSNYKNKYKGIFINHPYEIIAAKDNIIRGKVNNPQIEIDEFCCKEWQQNCGDIIKVLRKSEIKRNNTYLWECEFQKYPCVILAKKDCIIKGQVNNPAIEENNFIGQIFKQRCGVLKVLEKSKEIDKQRERYYYICQFEGYEEKIKAFKDKILRGVVDNPYLIWKIKEKLEEYLAQKETKVTLEDLAKELNVSRQQLGQNIIKFELQKYIDYSFIKSQEDVRKYIEDFIQTESYNDKNYKIDIYIPKFKLGIEYNGNYWHSDFCKDKLYHQKKSLYFKEKGIEILHIFEYEWLDKKEILLGIVKSKCGIFDKIIYARKCKIKEIDNNLYQNFCDKNHLQGQAGAKVKLGLFYKDELIQIMSFGVPRFTDKYEWEIIRECSKLDYCIIGGKERLWKYFVKKYNPKNCISYCDFSKFNGNSYLKINFKFKQLNNPGFVWFNKQLNETYWRNPYKHKEYKKYSRIWDCGQLVFEWFKK
jgi:hypothetical protein